MRENCTYGSVRGSRQAFHIRKFIERRVETVYSTEQIMTREQVSAWLEKHNWKRSSQDIYKKANRVVVVNSLGVLLNGTDSCIFYDEASLEDYGIVSTNAPVIILA